MMTDTGTSGENYRRITNSDLHSGQRSVCSWRTFDTGWEDLRSQMGHTTVTLPVPPKRFNAEPKNDMVIGLSVDEAYYTMAGYFLLNAVSEDAQIGLNP